MIKHQHGTKKSLIESVSSVFQAYSISYILRASAVIFLGVFLLDYYDIPSKIFMRVPDEIAILAMSVVVVVLGTIVISFHPFSMLKIYSANWIDAGCVVLAVVSFLYAALRYFLLGHAVYIWIALVCGVIGLSLFFIRFYLRYRALKNSEIRSNHLIDLKHLYDNDFEHQAGAPILLTERDVDYDLFGRNRIINHLYQAIQRCQSDQSYVISLEGAWGSGKTTIINNVKTLLKSNDSQIEIIDNFDPWIYGSQESLLVAMLEVLIQNTGIKYSPCVTQNRIKKLVQTVVDGHPTRNFLFNLVADHSEHDNISALKSRINSYLKTSSKQVVFFIDNLDRTNDTNITFLFKLISTVFDFPGIVYVLSFERDRINKVLTNTREYDSRFTEKIIQQVVTVPAASGETVKKVYDTCLVNILTAYGISGNDLERFKAAAYYIFEKTSNIREFTRMINTAMSTVFAGETLLDKADFLGIEIIRFYEPELYEKIYRNSDFFISHNRNKAKSFWASVNRESFNKKGKQFFDELFKMFPDEKELLKNIFPYVKRYLSGNELKSEYEITGTEDKNIYKKSSVCDGKYFDLYFSFGSNNYIRIRNLVEQYIDSINSSGTVSGKDLIEQLTEEAILALSESDQPEWVMRFQMSVDDINASNIVPATKALFKYFYRFTDDITWFAYSPRSKMGYVISLLLMRFSQSDFSSFLNEISEQYGYIELLQTVAAYMSKDQESTLQDQPNYSELLLAECNRMIEKVLTNGINLYDDDFYQEKNIWGLYRYCENTGRIKELKEYILSTLSATSVYRFLWDMANVSLSDHYSYYIRPQNVAYFLDDVSILDDLVKEHSPQTHDEGFVFELYQKYCEPGAEEDNSVSLLHAIHLSL